MKKILIFVIISLSFANYNDGLKYYKEQKYKLALEEFKKTNDAKSLLAIAIMYYNGDGVKKNIKQYLLYLKKSASLNNIDAIKKLGNYYAKKEDFKTSLKYFLKSAKLGDVESMYIVGYFYSSGLVKQDIKKAIYWYKKASDKNFINAKINLAYIYITQQKLKEASKLLQNINDPRAKNLWNEFQLYKYKDK